jgi:hypothetical protein
MPPERKWYHHPAALVAGALLLRYVAHSAMLLMALVAERRPAPTLPDAILDLVPRIGWVDRYNYHIWLVMYLPPAIVLGFRHLGPFLRFLVAGAIVSVTRGVCILLTGLGPVHGPDINAGMSWSSLFDAWFQLINPITTITGHAAHVHLTKDLFFSGHTATTFLLLLYCWRDPVLKWWTLASHVVVVATVFFSHLHYAIDVVGAWAIVFCAYALFEWTPKKPVKAEETREET